MTEYDILLRDASLDGTAETADVAIQAGQIERVSGTVEGTGAETIRAEGNFVSPGFVDCHMHLDRAFAVCGGRKPKRGEGSIEEKGFGGYLNDAFDEYHEETPQGKIEENAIRDIQRAVAAGTTHIRSHLAADHPSTTSNANALARAKERTAHLAEVQLVPMSSKGVLNGESAERYLREAVEIALEVDPSGDETLVGGADPASRNDNIDRTLAVWFDIATDYDIGIDVHIQVGGSLGEYTIQRLAERAKRHGYEGRVTSSHSFSLAHLPDWRLEELIPVMNEADLSLVTCYNSTRADMPVRTLLSEGVTLGHGTDNDRDFVIPHGNADTLAGALTEVNKLHGDRLYDRSYRWYETNEGLALLWEMITHQGAAVLGVEDEYGIAEGADANLVVFDEPSPQWSIIRQATRSCVIRDGTVVAEDGTLRPEHRVVQPE